MMTCRRREARRYGLDGRFWYGPGDGRSERRISDSKNWMHWASKYLEDGQTISIVAQQSVNCEIWGGKK